MKILGLILALLISFSLQAKNKVVYGQDDRVNPADASPMMQELALSTAAMIQPDSLEVDGDMVNILGVSLEERGLCSTARFSQQMSSALCSGFLVTDDLLVTAGHCIKSKSDCKKYKWVFDFADNTDGATSIQVKKTSVYGCKKIVERDLTSWSGNDFALIKLDRKVTDRAPLQVRTEGKITEGEGITVIGHPTGIPTKVAGGAYVRDNGKAKYFVTNLDTFGGNSGSAVFNSETGMVEGILVRGAQDYVTVGGCALPNHCEMDECRGEDVTRITNISKLMKLLR
jgi:hypothetical protein